MKGLVVAERACTTKLATSLAFAEFVAGEIAEAIVGCVFVGLAQRRIVENLLDEFVDRQAFVQDGHADVDQFGGDLADDADAEKLFVGAGEDEFEHAGVSPVMWPRALLA